ncbi:hypothetical protein N7507_009679 [Penicillium longicatenatum]|nr:hypothetical protein N7507_009679 [Penicillium longicatenatum]
MGEGGTLGMMTMSTSSSCWASNTPYLTSLAWCMHEKCHDVPTWKLEYFWVTEATGQSTTGIQIITPKWIYSEALANLTQAPISQLTTDSEWLNRTSLVSPEVYKEQWNVLVSVQEETTRENTYGIAMLVTGFGTPIVFTGLSYLPISSRLVTKLKPYLLWPSTIGTYQVRPLPYLLGNAPTIGQALYVVMFVILNIILTAVNYHSRQPNAWYSNTWREIMAYVLYRTVQVLLHSIIAVVLYKAEGTYDTQVKSPYWIWGIVATLCVVILTFGSGFWIRNFAYEFFLLMHIVLSVILIVGCWYHAYDLYKSLGGIEDWIYAMAGVWFFDRLLRIVRIVSCGPRHATVTEIGEGYMRIDLPGIRWGSDPGKHVYVYFPSLNPLRPWENHPFSVLPTALLRPLSSESADSENRTPRSLSGIEEPNDNQKGEAIIPTVKSINSYHPTVGVTLYVRKSTGTTKALCPQSSLLTFIEGPYPNNSTREVLRCDRLLLIGGGIGITGILPFATNHWNVKLAWSVKESARCLVDDLKGALDLVKEKDVRIGSRFDLEKLLNEEMEAGWDKVGVVVSGPGVLCDDARAAVVTAARLGKTKFELEVEAYSW